MNHIDIANHHAQSVPRPLIFDFHIAAKCGPWRYALLAQSVVDVYSRSSGGSRVISGRV